MHQGLGLRQATDQCLNVGKVSERGQSAGRPTPQSVELELIEANRSGALGEAIVDDRRGGRCEEGSRSTLGGKRIDVDEDLGHDRDHRLEAIARHTSVVIGGQEEVFENLSIVRG